MAPWDFFCLEAASANKIGDCANKPFYSTNNSEGSANKLSYSANNGTDSANKRKNPETGERFRVFQHEFIRFPPAKSRFHASPQSLVQASRRSGQ